MAIKTPDFIKRCLVWLRAEYKFALLVIIIVMAAVASLGYAYFRANDNPTATAGVVQTEQAGQFEDFDTAEQIAESAPDDTGTEPKPTENKSSRKPASPTTPGRALGSQIDCAQLEIKLGVRVLEIQKQITSNRVKLDVKLAKQLLSEYESYRKGMADSGCKTAIELPELTKLLTKLLPSSLLSEIL